MTSFQSILTLAVLVLAGGSTNLASGEDIPVENGVLVLTAQTFPGVVQSNEFVLVMFSGDKCGHCHRLMPTLEEVAAELATEQPEVARVAKVNVWAERSLMAEYGIKGVPDVRLFRGGKPVAKYGGKRTKEAILEWVKEKMAEEEGAEA